VIGSSRKTRNRVGRKKARTGSERALTADSSSAKKRSLLLVSSEVGGRGEKNSRFSRPEEKGGNWTLMGHLESKGKKNSVKEIFVS